MILCSGLADDPDSYVNASSIRFLAGFYKMNIYAYAIKNTLKSVRDIDAFITLYLMMVLCITM